MSAKTYKAPVGGALIAVIGDEVRSHMLSHTYTLLDFTQFCFLSIGNVFDGVDFSIGRTL
jgi:hypothetical protein